MPAGTKERTGFPQLCRRSDRGKSERTGKSNTSSGTANVKAGRPGPRRALRGADSYEGERVMHEVEPSSTVLREDKARAKLRTTSENHRQEPQARAGAKAWERASR